MYMPGGTSSSRDPDHVHHYKVGSVVMEPRATKFTLTDNFGTVISGKAPRNSHPPGQLTFSESCVALCRQCMSYHLVPVSLLNQGIKQSIIREIFHYTG